MDDQTRLQIPARKRPEPVQERARATRELLLQAAGHLIAEVGVERISSNLIVARAGLTPPAFYRYFKDKYDLLAELGERLMNTQNEIIAAMLNDPAQRVVDITVEQMEVMLRETVRVTKTSPGGPWVMRALRAVPALQDIRLKSHRSVAAAIAERVLREAPELDRGTALRSARLMIDLGYATCELAFDEPDIETDAMIREAALALNALAPWRLAVKR